MVSPGGPCKPSCSVGSSSHSPKARLDKHKVDAKSGDAAAATSACLRQGPGRVRAPGTTERYTRVLQGGSMRYRIAIHQSDEGYSVSVPGLPGCWSQGATDAEAVENIKDAIREYLAVVDEQLRGEEIREIDVAV